MTKEIVSAAFNKVNTVSSVVSVLVIFHAEENYIRESVGHAFHEKMVMPDFTVQYS